MCAGRTPAGPVTEIGLDRDDVPGEKSFGARRENSPPPEIALRPPLSRGARRTLGRAIPPRAMSTPDWAHIFLLRHPVDPEDARLAAATARVACGTLALLFVSTMVAFTALRFAGLKRVLVPRSGIIGVGVGWTIVSMTTAVIYASDPALVAPCLPLHALLVNVPQQTFFLLSLRRRRRLVTVAGALKLLATFLVGVLSLNLAQLIGASAPETYAGARKADGTREEIDVTRAAADVLVAVARACAGVLLVTAASERPVLPSRAASPASSANPDPSSASARKTVGTRQELRRVVLVRDDAVVASILAARRRSPTRLGGAVPAGAEGSRRGEMMVVWYAMRCVPYVLAQWGSLLVVKLAPARFFDADGDVDENKKNR